MIAQLHQHVEEFTLDLRINKVEYSFACLFETLETTEDEAEDVKEESSSEEEGVYIIAFNIDNKEYSYEGDLFWEAFLSVKTKRPGNVKRFREFTMRMCDSNITIKRGKKGTFVRVYKEGADPAKDRPLISIPVNDQSLADPGLMHPDIHTLLQFL